MKVIIIPYPGWGQMLAVYKFGHLLQKSGYTVTIAAGDQYRQSITDNGFSCIVYSLGADMNPPTGFFRRIQFYYRRLKERDALVDSLVGNMVDQHMPGLAFVDSGLSRIAFPFFSRKVTVMLFSTSICGDQSRNNPPFSSPIIPRFTTLHAAYIHLVWLIWYTRKWLFYFRTELFSLGHFDHSLKRIARKYGFPAKLLDQDRIWHTGFKQVPEIFFYASPFDFAPNTKPHKYFLGPMMDLDRNEADFEGAFSWDAINLNRYVVCCSLGTQARYYSKEIDLFYIKVAEAFRGKTDRTLIMAVGKGSTLFDRKLPENVFIFESIPQIEVLKRSHLMINHAGIGSVKECILLGVPVLVYPLDKRIDQNGTAARVQHFKLGLRGNHKNETTTTIAQKIETILFNSDYALNVKKWKAIFENAEKDHDIVSIIEKYKYAGKRKVSA